MGYRGRLIFPFLAEIRRLDRAGTAADPDGAGALTSGYDPIYREIRKLPDASRVGVSARVELAAIKIPAQFEPQAFRKLQQGMAGDLASTSVSAVLHFKDLERLGLVDPTTGMALIQKGDRLSGLYKMNGTLIQTIPNPPGAFVTLALPIIALSGDRNLLQVTFEAREPGK